MQKCTKCKKDYLGYLIQPMTTIRMGMIRRDPMCPICALKERNDTVGLPSTTPFQGEMAQMLYEEAVAYNKKRNKKHGVGPQAS